MIEERINGHIVLVEDDIQELSIKRFQKYNKFMLLESGIGSDLNDIIRHIDKACKLMNGNVKMANTELQNMKQTLYLISQELTPKYMAFACLVTRIDGQPISDISDENLKGIVHLLSGHKHRLLDKLIEAVKKKIEEALTLYFPTKFESAKTKQYYDELKEHTLLVLRGVQGEDTKKEQEAVEMRMASIFLPLSFTGSQSAEIQYDKEFEETCLFISKELHIEPKNLSVFAFYNSIEYMKKIQKERDKQLKQNRKNG